MGNLDVDITQADHAANVLESEGVDKPQQAGSSLSFVRHGQLAGNKWGDQSGPLEFRSRVMTAVGDSVSTLNTLKRQLSDYVDAYRAAVREFERADDEAAALAVLDAGRVEAAALEAVAAATVGDVYGADATPIAPPAAGPRME